MVHDRAVRTRRRFLQGGLALAGLGLLSGCGFPSLQARPATKVPRVGFLSLVPVGPSEDAFRQGLHELGYVEGQTITIEWRYAEGREEQLPALAAALVRLDVDVIVTAGALATQVAKQATQTIPIVFAGVGDAVETGLVASLARPGGNVTGLINLGPQLQGKRLELLREAVPSVSRVAVLWSGSSDSNVVAWRETQAPARALGFQLVSLDVRGPDDFDRAFEHAIRERAEALINFAAPVIMTAANQRRIVDFAARSRLPAL